jgi:tetratricopeptide (TPR) repeat protein
MAFLLDEPNADKVQHGEDIVALARFFEAMDDHTQSKALYQRALESEISEDLYWETLERFSFMLKRNDEWEEAIKLWERAADHNALYAHEELAKFYEHRAKDLAQALKWTHNALAILEKHPLPSYEFHQWQEEFSHRLARLERKSANPH